MQAALGQSGDRCLPCGAHMADRRSCTNDLAAAAVRHARVRGVQIGFATVVPAGLFARTWPSGAQVPLPRSEQGSLHTLRFLASFFRCRRFRSHVSIIPHTSQLHTRGDFLPLTTGKPNTRVPPSLEFLPEWLAMAPSGSVLPPCTLLPARSFLLALISTTPSNVACTNSPAARATS